MVRLNLDEVDARASQGLAFDGVARGGRAQVVTRPLEFHGRQWLAVVRDDQMSTRLLFTAANALASVVVSTSPSETCAITRQPFA